MGIPIFLVRPYLTPGLTQTILDRFDSMGFLSRLRRISRLLPQNLRPACSAKCKDYFSLARPVLAWTKEASEYISIFAALGRMGELSCVAPLVFVDVERSVDRKAMPTLVEASLPRMAKSLGKGRQDGFCLAISREM